MADYACSRKAVVTRNHRYFNGRFIKLFPVKNPYILFSSSLYEFFTGKLCDTLLLPTGIKSELRPLFGRTVSLILKSSGAKVVLHSKDESSAKTYAFGIGISGQCTLNRFDGTDTQVKSVACADVVDSGGLRSVWIDVRSANIVLGSGNTVIFQYLDSSPFEVGYISFEAATETTVTLCNRESK